eukprot:GSChrysophyteH2.ASY1.ANO1.1626.1 assembled CDS
MPQVLLAGLLAVVLDVVHILRVFVYDWLRELFNKSFGSEHTELITFYSGRTALITGASSGLGKELAQQLALVSNSCEHPINLILSSRDEEKLKHIAACCRELSPKSKVMVVLLDLSTLHDFTAAQTNDSTNISKSLQTYIKIHVLINNAGVSSRGLALHTSQSVLQSVMNVNFFGPVALTKAVLHEFMTSSGSSLSASGKPVGAIGVISSVQGRLGISERTSYAASKHALQGYFDCLRCELSSVSGDDYMSVTVISPGYIATSLSLNAITSTGKAYGKTDETTANGYSPSYAARQSLLAIARREVDYILGDARVQVAIQARGQLPELLAKKLASRSKK